MNLSPYELVLVKNQKDQKCSIYLPLQIALEIVILHPNHPVIPSPNAHTGHLGHHPQIKK